MDTKGSILYDYSFPLPIQAAAPYSREVQYLLSKKELVTLNGSNIQLLTMLSAKPGKQKNYTKACFDIGNLEQIP